MQNAGAPRVVSARGTLSPRPDDSGSTKDDMADDEVLEDATTEVADDDDEEEEEEEVFDGELEDGDGLVDDAAVAVDVDVVDDTEDVEEVASTEVDDAEAVAAKAKAKAKADEDDDEDDEADPDDVEEDLDTILRDRIAAGADDDDDDEEEVVVDQPEGGDRVAPRNAEEFSCPECFLLVRRSQFSTRRTDCPGGLDGADCPMKQRFG